MRLLVIGDEAKLAEYLRKGLAEEGCIVDEPPRWRYGHADGTSGCLPD